MLTSSVVQITLAAMCIKNAYISAICTNRIVSVFIIVRLNVSITHLLYYFSYRMYLAGKM